MKLFVAGLVLSGLALLTAHRVPVWHSDATLWAETARQMPQNARVLINWHAQQVQQMNVSGHFETCGRLMDARTHGLTDARETWIIDRICLAR